MNKVIKMVLLMVVMVLPLFANAQVKNGLGLNGMKQAKGMMGTSVAAKTASALNEPEKQLQYSWDSTSNAWVFQFEELMKYDNKGHVILNILLGDTINLKDTLSKVIITFGAYGLSSMTTFDIYNGKYQLDNTDSGLYDSKGNVIKGIGYNWNANKKEWELNSIDSSEFTFDNNGNVISNLQRVYDVTNKVWTNYAETNLSVNSDGSWKTDTSKIWNGKNWVIFNVVDSMIWKTWGGNPSNSLLSSDCINEWNGSKWQDSLYDSCTYTINGDIFDTSKVLQGGKWIYNSSGFHLFDSLGNEKLFVQEIWNGTAWLQDFGSLDIYTYDMYGNIIQDISQNYYTSSKKYINWYKDVYSDFNTLTSIKQATPTTLPITLYPNPATETLHLQANINSNENMDITIYTMQGQAALHEQINGSELSSGINIPVNNLVNGMYILRAVSGSGESRVKFVKE